MSVKDFIIESIATNLFEIDKSWAESDAARDRGENWLADEIAKRRRELDGQNIAFQKVAVEIGFSPRDIIDAAYDGLRDRKAEEAARDELFATPTLKNLSALLD